MKSLLAIAALFAIPASAATYYVRTDGGLATQCDGMANVAVQADKHCAWISPMVALPPAAYGSVGTPMIQASDTLQIADGSYPIGYGSPNTGTCNSSANFDCAMAPPPSGVDASHRTKIIGNLADPSKVELWGNERVTSVLRLGASNYVEVGGLTITDHSSCIRHQSQGPGGPSQYNPCTDSYPSGPWAENGITANDSTGLYLHDLNIHGLGNEGIRAGRLTDVTVQRVKINANGFAGWDWDIGATNGNSSGNHGNLSFTDLEVSWNGCGEKYPTGEIYGCWDQNIGGYGDGIAAGHTDGNWTFLRAHIHHNVQDGLDLLYGSSVATITVRDSWFHGNSGNQLKLRGKVIDAADSVIDGDCAAAFSTAPPLITCAPGAPCTVPPAGYTGKFNMDLGGTCRVGGDAVALSFANGTTARFVNNTVTGQSEGLVVASQTGDDGGSTGATLLLANNIIEANNVQSWQLIATSGYAQTVDGFYTYQTNPTVTQDHNIYWGIRNCAGCTDPKLTNPSPIGFDPRLLAGSAAKGAGNPANCAIAGATCDIGALSMSPLGGNGTAQPPPPPPAQAPIICTDWHALKVTPTARAKPKQPIVCTIYKAQ